MNVNPYESPIVRAELVDEPREPAILVLRRMFWRCILFLTLAVAVLFTPSQYIVGIWVFIASMLGVVIYACVGIYELIWRPVLKRR